MIYSPMCIHICVCTNLVRLIPLSNSWRSKVSGWYKMMTDCLKPCVLAFSISSLLLGQDRLRWADDNRVNFFFFLSFYIYKTTSFIPTIDNWSSEQNKIRQNNDVLYLLLFSWVLIFNLLFICVMILSLAPHLRHFFSFFL
jgi:hypothetical protein